MTTSRHRPKADELIDGLGLQPHPEGGWWAQTWLGPADPNDPDGRPVGTAIAFLLKAGERSHWHRLDAVEVWHRQAGSPLALSVWTGDGPIVTHVLGTNVVAGERPHTVVPARSWQTARTLGSWTLVACTMTPGFHVSGFELAVPDWTPSSDDT